MNNVELSGVLSPSGFVVGLVEHEGAKVYYGIQECENKDGVLVSISDTSSFLDHDDGSWLEILQTTGSIEEGSTADSLLKLINKAVLLIENNFDPKQIAVRRFMSDSTDVFDPSDKIEVIELHPYQDESDIKRFDQVDVDFKFCDWKSTNTYAMFKPVFNHH